MRASVAGAALIATLLAGPAAAADPAPFQVKVEGRIVDEVGEGVPAVAVRLLQSRREFHLADWSFEDLLKKEPLTRTDEHGFFEAEITADREFRAFWLRFYDPQTFDAVRYRLPEDHDVSRDVRKGRPVFVEVVLLDGANWVEVRRLVERLGDGTPRAQLVRQMGPPDRRDEADGLERFYYQRPGVVYRFRDGEFVGKGPWEAEAGGDGVGGSKGS
jgi:hypothetical protein